MKDKNLKFLESKMNQLLKNEESINELPGENTQCRKCGGVLPSKEIQDFVKIKRADWIQEGVWYNNALHTCYFTKKCPTCETPHFFYILVRRYTNKIGVERYRIGSLVYSDPQDFADFATSLNKEVINKGWAGTMQTIDLKTGEIIPMQETAKA